MSNEINQLHVPPDWAFTFHGHRCPFMPLGYRMGQLALAALGVSREADPTLHVICELGEYVFERYVRYQNGLPVCIPCSSYLR